MSAANMERLEELLVDRAVHGIGGSEHAELQGLLAQHPEVDSESYELAAAAVELVVLEEVAQGELPEGVRARLEVAADEHVARAAEAARFTQPREKSAGGLAAWSGWMVAAAAIVVAILSFATGGQDEPIVRPVEDPVSLRASLLQAPDVQTLSWTEAAEGAAPGASGDVVWSDVRQEGYMRFRNFAANDPAVEQYQLWIFDAERSADYPVDGGVFDIPVGKDEVVVPIRAKLPVERATLFAITVEKPGGVVVSSRERLPLLAKVEG